MQSFKLKVIKNFSYKMPKKEIKLFSLPPFYIIEKFISGLLIEKIIN